MLDSFFKKALSDAKGSFAAKVKACEQAKREREELAAAPGTQDDVIALISEQIDQDAAAYPARLMDSIKTTLGFGVDRQIGPGGAPSAVPLFLAREYQHREPTPRDIEASLSFIFGKELKKAISETVRSMTWPTNAQPLKGRAGRLAELDNRIAALETEISTMRADAQAAGVIL